MLVLTALLCSVADLEVRSDQVALTATRDGSSPTILIKLKSASGVWSTVLRSSDAHNRASAAEVRKLGTDRLVLDFKAPGQSWKRVYRVSEDKVAVSTEVRFTGSRPKVRALFDGYCDVPMPKVDVEALSPMATPPGPMPRGFTLGGAMVGLPGSGGVTAHCSVLVGSAYAGFGLWSEPTVNDGVKDDALMSVPQVCSWSYVIFPDTDMDRSLAKANAWSWSAFGHGRLSTALPQCMPFSAYTKNAYALGASEEEGESMSEEEAEESGPWWKAELGDREVGAPRRPGFASWDGRGNAAKAAWGLRWWGERLKIPEWEERGEEFFRLTMAAEMKDGRLPSRFDLESKKWGYERSFPVEEATVDSTVETLLWARAILTKWPDAADEGKLRHWALQLFNLHMTAGQPAVNSRPRPAVLFELAERALASDEWGEDVREAAKAFLEREKTGGVFDLEQLLRPDLGPDVARAARKGSQSDLKNLARRVGQVVFGQSVLDDPRLDAPLYGSLTYGYEQSFTSRTGDLALDLMRTGVLLGRKDVFERGVAMLRSLFARTVEPTHTLNGLGPLDGDLLGQTGELLDPRTGDIVPRRSFECGEGALLADCAKALDEFGGFMVHPGGWAVGVDGCVPGPGHSPVSVLTANPKPYSGPQDIDVVSPHGRVRTTAVFPLVIASMRLEVRSGRTFVVAVPGVLSSDTTVAAPAGVFTCPDAHWTATAKLGRTGLESVVPVAVLRKGAVRFKGRIGGQAVSKSAFLPVDAPASLIDGWSSAVAGRIPVTPSLWSGRGPALSTGDDGFGRDQGVRTGVIRSRPFTAVQGSVTFLARADEGTSVRLVDAGNGAVLAETKGPASAKVHWNLRQFAGHRVRIELVDTTGKGSVAISDYVRKTS